jgi:hypothetical protein
VRCSSSGAANPGERTEPETIIQHPTEGVQPKTMFLRKRSRRIPETRGSILPLR